MSIAADAPTPVLGGVRSAVARGLLLGAALCVVVLALIVANLAQSLPLGLHRFRETSLALYAFVGLALIVAPERRLRAQRWLERARGILQSRAFLPCAATCLGAIFVSSSLTQHLAYRTFSHDFSMVDEALYWSHHGELMFSPVLGRSYLSEHFSPVLLALVPLHALWPGPIVWLLAPAFALLGAAILVQRLVRAEGHSRALANLALVVWACHPVVVRTLEYPSHVEAFLPVLLFGAYLAWQGRQLVGAVVLLVLALTVKEDVGVYVAGLGAWLALARRRRTTGALVAALGLGWSYFALRVALPHFAGGPDYSFLSRWSQWGHGFTGVLRGFLSRPQNVVTGMLTGEAIRLHACLGFLPLTTLGGWLFVLPPWVVNTTSGNPQHAGLGIYYGLPLLAFATIAGVAGLRSPAFQRVTSSRFAPVFAIAVVMLNVAHFSFPPVEHGRGRFAAALRDVPENAHVQAMACFFPVLGYERPKLLLTPATPLEEHWVVVRLHSSTWPFSGKQVEDLVREATESGAYRVRADVNGSMLLERLDLPGRGSPSVTGAARVTTE